MSMQNYAEFGFGLVLTGAEIDNFIKTNDESETIEDAYDFVEVCEEKKHTVRYYDEEMDGRSVYYLNGESDEHEDMLVVWTLKQPDVFKPVYEGIDDVIQEIKQEFTLPSDFDWEGHLGYFSCCVYC